MQNSIDKNTSSPGTALLYGFIRKNDDADLDELAFLAESAGITVLDHVAQRGTRPNPRCYISDGATKDLREIVELMKPDMVIFDCELKGSQRKNLETEIDTTVIDRTEVILDIFASRANTREGKLQVELAQLMYLRPRLMGMGKRLSALGGGIGTRGPGETKLEMDRRRIDQRIAHLEHEIKTIERHRGTQRKNRMKSGILKIALVGYTNAGKSTLLNALTGADAYADNRLFATLDTLTRKGFLASSRREFLMTDTVGFIRRIPTQLIAAFKATLEEINYSDLLLIIVDINDEDFREKLEVVHQTLGEIGAGEIPKLVVYNKIDLIENTGQIPIPEEIAVSALRGDGLDLLREKIDKLTLHESTSKKDKEFTQD